MDEDKQPDLQDLFTELEEEGGSSPLPNTPPEGWGHLSIDTILKSPQVENPEPPPLTAGPSATNEAQSEREETFGTNETAVTQTGKTIKSTEIDSNPYPYPRITPHADLARMFDECVQGGGGKPGTISIYGVVGGGQQWPTSFIIQKLLDSAEVMQEHHQYVPFSETWKLVSRLEDVNDEKDLRILVVVGLQFFYTGVVLNGHHDAQGAVTIGCFDPIDRKKEENAKFWVVQGDIQVTLTCLCNQDKLQLIYFIEFDDKRWKPMYDAIVRWDEKERLRWASRRDSVMAGK
ncbi:hypothetical protein EJ08DRAFT_738802 [Tothia fuscella]|uniref:Uncharacterized protein n=1 Tax=Tothia fuscella TaxID=1048955 RepID=A0A9P4TTI9_9PEZI|nr:hypothetical protein EJ08DRAFT_738802 [Tothia fuscella]